MDMSSFPAHGFNSLKETKMKKLLLLASIALFAAPAFAQSDPGLYNGQIPTAAQWLGGNFEILQIGTWM